MPRRWYQVLDVGDNSVVYEDPQRKDSKFWNEGKWNNFIDPLLPRERQAFLELGCNAGLYLKMACDAGFERVTGVESSRQIMKQAQRYKELNGAEYTLINKAVGLTFDPEDVHLADVVLLSNMHYYLPVDVLAKLADVLRNRCLYLILVAAKARPRVGRATHYLQEARGYFKDWHELELIHGLPVHDDPSPRQQMYSVLFKGNLRAMSVDKMYASWAREAQSWKSPSRGMPEAMLDFFERVVNGDKIDYESTPFFEYWQTRGTHRNIVEWLKYKEELAKDIQQNGMREPIYMCGHNEKMRDGIHRLCIAKVLGFQHVWTRDL
jgi:SAM-dependent methyltransferase